MNSRAWSVAEASHDGKRTRDDITVVMYHLLSIMGISGGSHFLLRLEALGAAFMLCWSITGWGAIVWLSAPLSRRIEVSQVLSS